MICGLPGAKITDPIASEGCASVNGAHVAPAFALLQMPPPAEPSSQWLEFEGSTANEVMRPVGPALPVIGAGPMLVHTCPLPRGVSKSSRQERAHPHECL